mmetsp:Transcript_35657/g.57288  ORF Transcript_35657/g.57288 Transcript_35657/m.57288 type:complete len:339 (-) Transcript_35657:271-1287(-)
MGIGFCQRSFLLLPAFIFISMMISLMYNARASSSICFGLAKTSRGVSRIIRPLSTASFISSSRMQSWPQGRRGMGRRGRSSLVSASSSNEMEVSLIPCLSDNYAYLLHNSATGTIAIVDPSEAAPVRAELQMKNLGRIDYILNTHHHFDHIGGNIELKEEFGAKIIGPAADKERIPGIDEAYADGERFDMGGEEVVVLHTPGHTSGHCAFYLPRSAAVFTGDTLFSLGCGRLFEGTAAQMHESLNKISALPKETLVYCGHEYTQSNAKFALAVDSENGDLQKRNEEISQLRRKNTPTIPTTIGLETATNPFLRIKYNNKNRNNNKSNNTKHTLNAPTI